MKRNILIPAVARAQGYHWLQQSWHLKAQYLNGRITTRAVSSSTVTAPTLSRATARIWICRGPSTAWK